MSITLTFFFCCCCCGFVCRYIIPTPVIKHFLSFVEKNGYYIGFDLPDISCQAMENSQIRKQFKMNHGMSGILINEINLVSAPHKILEKDDVILAIDGVPIGNDEKCNFFFLKACENI